MRFTIVLVYRVITSGSTHSYLAAQLANHWSASYLPSHLTQFLNGEIYVRFENDGCQKELMIVQSIEGHDHFMELLLMINAARKNGFTHIVCMISYLFYGRNDQSADCVVRLLKEAGANRLITFDYHSMIDDFDSFKVQNVPAWPIFVPTIQKYGDVVLVSPDMGGFARVQSMGKVLNLKTAMIHKMRVPQTGEVLALSVSENIEDATCILVDDMIDTGATLCAAADLLMSQGAKCIIACATHAVFSNNCLERFSASCIKHIYVTNTIERDTQAWPTKMTVLDVYELLDAANI